MDQSDSLAIKIGSGAVVGSNSIMRISSSGVSIGNNPINCSVGALLCVQGGAAVERLYARGGSCTAAFHSVSGTSGTCSVIYGSDLAFHISFTPGGTPNVGDYIQVTFNTSLASGKKPIVTLQENTGVFVSNGLGGYTPEANKSNTGFRIYFNDALPAGVYEMDVHVISN